MPLYYRNSILSPKFYYVVEFHYIAGIPLLDITKFCYTTKTTLHYHNSITRCNGGPLQYHISPALPGFCYIRTFLLHYWNSLTGCNKFHYIDRDSIVGILLLDVTEVHCGTRIPSHYRISLYFQNSITRCYV